MLNRLFRRRRFLIQPKFQLALGGGMMVLLFAYSAILVFSILYPMATFLELSPEGSVDPEIKQRVLTISPYVWLIVIILGLLLAFQAILFSHRIVGPAFRLGRAVREMSAGEYQQNLILRRHDCLNDLATDLAQLGSLLHGRRERLLVEVAGLRADLEEHRRRLERGGDMAARAPEVAGILRRIQAVEQLALGLPEGRDTPTLAAAEVPIPGSSPSPAG
jgi:methyl-accepting chemotaxis protein